MPSEEEIIIAACGEMYDELKLDIPEEWMTTSGKVGEIYDWLKDDRTRAAYLSKCSRETKTLLKLL